MPGVARFLRVTFVSVLSVPAALLAGTVGHALPAGAAVVAAPDAVHSPAAALGLTASDRLFEGTAAITAHHHASQGRKQGAAAVAISTIGLLALVIGTILVLGRRRGTDGRMPKGIFTRTPDPGSPKPDGGSS
jgi:hypothetical protein